MANKKQDFGTIIEQWFKRFELIAKGDVEDYFLTKGSVHPLVGFDLDNRSVAISNNEGYWEWFTFDEVPDYFEIRIRE